MEILAGLVNLVDDDHLPAPWFNRPSLGLLSNTPVSLGVLKSTDRSNAPPDIIVTPLQAGIMHYTVSVIVDFDEKPGVVFDALKQISTNFNIALAETVTINQRSQHRVTLVLEYPDFLKAETQDEIIATTEKFNRDLSKLEYNMKSIKGNLDYSDWRVIGQKTNFETIESGIVDQGLIRCPRIREFFRQSYYDRFNDQFNFDAVVVSSSADGRFIRYITPKKGTFEVTVSHKDTPGSLRQVSSALHELEYNILLSRLSRSVGTAPKPGTSTYVAVCEPPKQSTTAPKPDTNAIRKEISKKLEVPAALFQLSVDRVTDGTTPERIAFPYRTGLMPHVREIHAPRDFRSYLYDGVLQKALSKKKAVFVSYQNPVSNLEAERVLNEAIYAEIEKSGMVVFDGFSKPQPVRESQEVRARMWRASAAIFVVRDTRMGMRNSGSRQSKGKGLSAEQLAEWGMIYGQGKPWFVICQEGVEAEVRKFMIPETPFITYKNINSLNVNDFRKQMAERIIVTVRRVPRLSDLHPVLGAMFYCFFQFQGSNS
jgi:hypothetical protein